MFDLENQFLIHIEEVFMLHIYLKSSFVCHFGLCIYLCSFIYQILRIRFKYVQLKRQQQQKI